MPSSAALLRRINVGGKNLIRMPDLAACFRDACHEDVRTHIQKWQRPVQPDRASRPQIERAVERMLQERFEIPTLVVVRSREDCRGAR